MAPLAYLSLHIAVWTLIELLRLPNQRFGGYRASAERTNQPHDAALRFFPTGDSNSALAQHISLGAAIYFIFTTLLGGNARNLTKMAEPWKSDDPAGIRTWDLPISCQLL